MKTWIFRYPILPKLFWNKTSHLMSVKVKEQTVSRTLVPFLKLSLSYTVAGIEIVGCVNTNTSIVLLATVHKGQLWNERVPGFIPVLSSHEYEDCHPLHACYSNDWYIRNATCRAVLNFDNIQKYSRKSNLSAWWMMDSCVAPKVFKESIEGQL